jgi:hypothetical protein
MRVQTALGLCQRNWSKDGDWTKDIKIKKGFAALKHNSQRELVRRRQHGQLITPTSP